MVFCKFVVNALFQFYMTEQFLANFNMLKYILILNAFFLFPWLDVKYRTHTKRILSSFSDDTLYSFPVSIVKLITIGSNIYDIILYIVGISDRGFYVMALEGIYSSWFCFICIFFAVTIWKLFHVSLPNHLFLRNRNP